jgi:hypothetical protein
MNCGICSRQGHQLVGNGICGECGLAVCVQPPLRRDRVYHADHCGCGCSTLVCEIDLRQHAAKHGGSPMTCFPGLSAVVSLGAAGVSAAPSGTGGSSAPRIGPSDLSVLNRFLNCVTPGHAAFQGMRERGPRWWSDVAFVDGLAAFDAGFYDTGRLARVGALALLAARQAARRLPTDLLLRELPPLTRLHVSRMLGVGARAPIDEAGAPLPHQHYGTWFRAAVTEWLQRLATRRVETTDGALPAIEVPRLDDADRLADWVVNGTDSDRGSTRFAER